MKTGIDAISDSGIGLGLFESLERRGLVWTKEPSGVEVEVEIVIEIVIAID